MVVPRRTKKGVVPVDVAALLSWPFVASTMVAAVCLFEWALTRASSRGRDRGDDGPQRERISD